LALKPVAFHDESDKTGTPPFALIFEEVEKVSPDPVAGDDQGKLYRVLYEVVNAMLLNEFLKEHTKGREQDRKIEEQGAMIAEQQKQIQTLTAAFKEQAAQIQKVSDQLEMTKPASQMVLNNQ
jgi:septal ring factor EnvC (AmiA/AmiB activator)